MSVVIAIKDEEGFTLGADRQVTCGSSKHSISKIFKKEEYDNVLIGAVGNLNTMQAIQYAENLLPKDFRDGDKIDTKFVFNKIYPRIFELFCDVNHYKDSDKSGLYTDAIFIFIYKDKGWLIERDGTVLEIEDYIATGSGEQFAKGSLDTTIGEDPVTRIEKAIKTTAKHHIYVNDEVDILTSNK